MLPVGVKVWLVGAYSSAVASTTAPGGSPPVTRTVPSLSNVAVWLARAVPMLPVVGVKDCVVGSNSSAVAIELPVLPKPPVTSTRLLVQGGEDKSQSNAAVGL